MTMINRAFFCNFFQVLTGDHSRLAIGPAILAVIVCANLAPAQPTITNLGVLDGGNFSYATAISANGLVVCGSSTSSGGQRAFRWTETDGLVSLGALSGFTSYSVGQAVSDDGAFVAGSSYGANNSARGFRWSSSTGLQSVSVLGTGSASYASAISANGSVIAGASYTAGLTGFTGTRWTSPTGLQSLVSGSASNGAAISADGMIIVGSNMTAGIQKAMRWTSVGGIQNLGLPSSALGAQGFATSADGSVVAGSITDGDSLNDHAFIWTGLPGGGGMQDLGTLDGDEASVAYAISGDGMVVGGYSALPGGNRAFLWTSSLGLVDLNTYLPSLGVDLAGWTLEVARGFSFDGTSVVGEGTYNGALRAFLVRGLPMCGPASNTGDGNADGATDGLDIQGLVNFMSVGGSGGPAQCAYDMNHDGVVNAADVPIFVVALLGT